MKPDLYEKELVGHTTTDMVYMVKPVPKAILFMRVLHRIRVEEQKAFCKLDYEERKDRS